MESSLPTHVAGLILARGGSQGIPLKNVTPLGGKPLLSWALEAMTQAKELHSVWVSTDHDDIEACAKKHPGVQVSANTGLECIFCKHLYYYLQVFRRSAAHAGPTASSVSSVLEFLAAHPEVGIVCMVQCTSPFVRADIIDEALCRMREEQLDSIFTVTRLRISSKLASPQRTCPFVVAL